MANRIQNAVAELKAALAEAGIEGFGIRLYDLDDGEMLRYVMGKMPVFAIPATAPAPAAFGTSIAEVGVMWVNARKAAGPLTSKTRGPESSAKPLPGKPTRSGDAGTGEPGLGRPNP